MTSDLDQNRHDIVYMTEDIFFDQEETKDRT